MINKYYRLKFRKGIAALMAVAMLATTVFSDLGPVMAAESENLAENIPVSAGGILPDKGISVSIGDIGILPSVSGNESTSDGTDVSTGNPSVSDGNLLIPTITIEAPYGTGSTVYDGELFKNGEKVEDVTVMVQESEETEEVISEIPQSRMFTEAAVPFGMSLYNHSLVVMPKLYLAPSASVMSLTDGSDITINKGDNIKYSSYGFSGSNWSTHRYTVTSGGSTKTAYCIEPDEAAASGSGLSANARPDLVLLAKTLYFGFGGGENEYSSIYSTYDTNSDGSDNYNYLMTHILASYCYRDNDNDFLHGLGIDTVDGHYLGSIIAAIDDLPDLIHASASKDSLIGIVENGFIITPYVYVSGDVKLKNNVQMQVGKNGSWHSSGKTVQVKEKNVRFRVAVDKIPAEGRTDTISISGRDVDTWVITGNGQQDISYTTFESSSADLTIKWETKPTEAGTRLAFVKYGESLTGIDDGSSDNQLSPWLGGLGGIQFTYEEIGLEGAEFELYVKTAFTGLDGKSYSAGQKVGTATSDDIGEVLFEEIQYADNEANNYKTEYFLKEIRSVNGHVMDTTVHDLTLSWESGKGTVWTGDIFTDNEGKFYNKRKKASVQLWKKDSNKYGDAPKEFYLPHAKFTLYTKDDIYNNKGELLLTAGAAIETVETDSDGKAQFVADLPYGYSYYIKEVEAPSGYEDGEYEYEFTWTTDENEETTYFPGNDESTASITNDRIYTSLSVTKYDSDYYGLRRGDAKINGAVFQVTAAEDIAYPDGFIRESLINVDQNAPAETIIWPAGTKIADLVIGDAESCVSYVDTATFKLTFSAQDGEATVGGLYPYGKYKVKEIKAPEGFIIDTTEHIAAVKTTMGSLDTIVKDYTIQTANVTNTVEKQYFSIQKYGSNGVNSELEKLAGAGFKLYLLSEMVKTADGAYDYDNSYAVKKATLSNGRTFILTSKEEEEALVFDESDVIEDYTLITDAEGKATSEYLPYGTYLLYEYQVPEDRIRMKDVIIEIDQDSETDYFYGELELINRPIAARIRIMKYDSDTNKPVKVEGTAFQIYRLKSNSPTDYADVDATGNPVPYSETYTENGKTVTVDTFYTDKDGYVITHELLEKGYYKVVEKATQKDVWVGIPEGYAHDKDSYEIVSIDSNADIWEDEEGNPVVDVKYFNAPQKGKFTIDKQGGILTGVEKNEDGSVKKFVYSDTTLAGAVFEVYADGDIVTYDNQGTTYYKDGELVTTITTGSTGKATAENLPIGKYKVIEKTAPTGFVTSTEVIKVEIKYVSPYDDPVAVITYPDKDKKAFINERQKLDLRIFKKEYVGTNDGNDGGDIPLEGVTFELYAAEDIVAKEGTVLVAKDSLIAKATSDKDGIVDWGLDLPFAKYKIVEIGKEDYYCNRVDENGNKLPNDFTVDTEPVTPDKKVADFTSKVYNKPTLVIVSKLSITNSQELPGAHLAVKDADGKIVREWVSSTKPKRVTGLKPNILPEGTTFDTTKRDGLIIYTLVETRPADGYTTADEIEFVIVGEQEIYTWTKADEETGTAGHWENAKNGKVTMIDYPTRIEITKYDIANKKELPGATLQVEDMDGKVIDEWVSTTEAHVIEGTLIVGKTYKLVEVKAPKGYKKAKSIKFTIEDNGAVAQKVKMYDRREGEHEDEEGLLLLEEATLNLGDQTGEGSHAVLFGSLAAFLLLGSTSAFMMRRRKRVKK